MPNLKSGIASKTLNKRGHSLIKLLNWQNKNFIIRPFY
ncbi:Uncharacterised protein [Vibrio cholerae]|nr:Uncharacterised protein [Vibrio cholerae]